MELINEMISDWELKDLVQEMDEVLSQYKNLIMLSQLNEGVLDNLGDELVQKVSEIQRRIEVISKARNIVKKLEQSGGFSKEDAKKHRDRLTKNRKALSAALKRTSSKMTEFEKAAKQELKKASDTSDNVDPNSKPNVSSDAVSLEPFGRQAPFLLKQASEGNLDVNSDNFDRYLDTYEMLVSSGLLSDDGEITSKGQASLDNHRAKRQNKFGSDSRSAIDDLADMGSSDDLDDISNF